MLEDVLVKLTIMIKATAIIKTIYIILFVFLYSILAHRTAYFADTIGVALLRFL